MLTLIFMIKGLKRSDFVAALKRIASLNGKYWMNDDQCQNFIAP